MKKLLLIGVFVLIASVVFADGIKAPIVTALNSSTYTAILSPGGCGGIGVYTEDGTSFYIATDSSGTGEAIVPADTSISFGNVCPEEVTNIVLYAKSASGTPNLVLLWSK